MNPSSSPELLFSNEEFVSKTINQIKKDTQHFIEVPAFKSINNDVYKATIIWIQNIVNLIFAQNKSQFFQWLYRIDVSEKKIKEVELHLASKSSELIAKIILEREAKKVFLRLKYSKN